MKGKGRKTFTKPPDQIKSKSTKQKQIKEQDEDERDWMREETLEYTTRNHTT